LGQNSHKIRTNVGQRSDKGKLQSDKSRTAAGQKDVGQNSDTHWTKVGQCNSRTTVGQQSDSCNFRAKVGTINE
jgi:hypothetical protein